MTLDEFILKYEDGLRSQLFGGFFFDDRDPAMRYRKMQADSAVLRSKIVQMYNDFFPPAKQPSQPGGSNGKAVSRQEIKKA